MAEQYSIVYMYYNFFIHLSVDGHLGCFHVLATANSAARHHGMQSQVAFRKHHYKTLVSGGDGIPVELFQILKYDAVKVLHSICSTFGKLSSGHRTGKGQLPFHSQRKAMPKNVQTTA